MMLSGCFICGSNLNICMYSFVLKTCLQAFMRVGAISVLLWMQLSAIMYLLFRHQIHFIYFFKGQKVAIYQNLLKSVVPWK